MRKQEINLIQRFVVIPKYGTAAYRGNDYETGKPVKRLQNLPATFYVDQHKKNVNKGGEKVLELIEHEFKRELERGVVWIMQCFKPRVITHRVNPQQ